MSMKYVAAYLMALQSGDSSPSSETVKKILSSVGANVDSTVLANFMESVKGKDPQALIAEGLTLLQSAAPAASASAPGPAAASQEAPAEEVKPAESEPEDESEGEFDLDIFG
ncbi:ribosomal protein RPP2 [Cardiosporidium cionae]|uniref:Ribosomal protein RPP2 n=1 Tax=Cardiosporidium cionae TaxID=476202 RepID=A0ABQ7J6Z2_9APIC|nr:ribosomal protein RPP2 [Cardiosporidium cionae]|eukprot:KAF8819689.1 ribosomal protein RPP2 [Cardiosporidium cionae]